MIVSDTHPQHDNDKLRQFILDAKKVLFIGAHPDDIEWYCGGLVYLLMQKNIEVVFAVATRGGKGYTGLTKRLLEALRSRHQLNAARVLGGACVLFYNYSDKRLDHYVEQFANDISNLIDQENPDIVFSWDPDFIYNPHPDHIAAAKALSLAPGLFHPPSPIPHPPKICYYGTRQPNLWIGYGDDVFRIKLKSISAHKTEMLASLFYYGRKYLVTRSKGEGEKISADYAETYRFDQEIHKQNHGV